MCCLFPSDIPDEMAAVFDSFPIGDLVICIPVVLAEAQEQSKAPLTHFHAYVGTWHLASHGL